MESGSDQHGQPGDEATRRLGSACLLAFAASEAVLVITWIIFHLAGGEGSGYLLAQGLISAALVAVLVAGFYMLASRALERAAHSGRLRLATSEQRYQKLFETSMDGIVHMDMEGRVLESNPAFAEMLGYSPSSLEGKSYFDVTPGKWRGVDWDVITNQLLVTGRSDKYFKEYVRKDGSLVPVSVLAWLDRDQGGEPAGIWARAEDISEQKRYEEFIRETIVRLEQANDRLREMDLLKTEFVAVVSHELRAPLAAIESALGALRVLPTATAGKEREELLSVLDRGVIRLSRLVDDLLDITRIESGQLKLEMLEVDPVELATRVVETYHTRAEDKGVALVLSSAGETASCNCDPRRIEQVLTNLVDNALKFTPAGEVRINVDSSPSRVAYSVADSGPGIPPELQQRVFEKFFSSPPVVESGPQGTGLGLAISRGIVEAHGGTMKVASNSPRGAVFTFELPC